MKAEIDGDEIVVKYNEPDLPDERTPRPPMYTTPEQCLYWVKAAFGCTRCNGGGNTSTYEQHSNPDRTGRVIEACQDCQGRGIMI